MSALETDVTVDLDGGGSVTSGLTIGPLCRQDSRGKEQPVHDNRT